MQVYAPLSGKVVALKDVPDAAFAQKMLGDGLAIESNQDKSAVITAPINGLVATINKNGHAVVIKADDGTEVLIHIGIDTVNLGGTGFKVLTKVGKRVKVGDKLIKADLKYIRANAPGSMVIIIVTDSTAVITATAATTVNEGDNLFSAALNEAAPAAAIHNFNPQSWHNGEWLTIINPNGLHARPANNVVKQAQMINGAVMLEKEGAQPVDAKSLSAIMNLQLAKGDKVRFVANAERRLENLSHYLSTGAGEDIKAEEAKQKFVNLAVKAEVSDKIINFAAEAATSIAVASPGLAIGTAYLLERKQRELPEEAVDNAANEAEKLAEALYSAGKAIKTAINTADNETKAILEAHLSFMEDPALYSRAEELIKAGKTAAYAWQQVINHEAEQLAKSSSSYLAARAIDMYDVGDQVLDVLVGAPPAMEYPAGTIVIAHEFTPSMVSSFNKNVVGAVSVLGSPTGHAAIMLRNGGLPSLYNAPPSLLKIPADTVMIIDGNKELLITNPNADTQQDYQQKIKEIIKHKEAILAVALEPAITKDGHRVEVSGNVSSVEEGVKATQLGAEGYGLVRSEFLFEGRQTSPSEAEQLEVYQGLLEATNHEVTVRLLDAGGDKPIVYVHIPKEDNPLLGIRGMRIAYDNEELYRTQIRALLKCTPLNRLKIMVPMIALLGEVDFIRKLFDEELAKLNIKPKEGPKFGIMAETPAVMILAEQFARKVDFFSVGTNDLTQYTLAMDRTSSRLASIAKAGDPAVLNLIALLCKGAAKHNKPVAVCGAAASDKVTALLFVGLGVTELAVAGVEIAEIKAALRNYTLAELQAVAGEALVLSTAAEVVKFTKERLRI
ncbi:MAG: phosphoenolpyruvate--protein phosphotransferase [Spirochaetaceae bacterium]|nr:phosphoenolpyruvate--protein phosphotransferase [Spirochaetaceae bacterium]